jgi:putative MATE family efflux protein
VNDLTTGSIPRHIIRLAVPMALGMIFQTLYYLVDLYFVARLGDAAVAGVSAAGNVQFIVMAFTQILGVSTMALIAQAVGRKDQPDANLVFNQSVLWAFVCGIGTLVVGYALCSRYMGALGSNPETIAAGTSYLRWYIPGLALQFALVSMGSALRGIGIVKPGMLVQMLTVVLNVVFAPILIAGWGTGRPLGVAGAGLASSLAIGIGVLVMLLYFIRLEHYVAFRRELLAVRTDVLARMLRIGVPPGVEFALLFLFTAVIFTAIKPFGPEAQAGYGIGSRVIQSLFLPAMAVSFSAAPLAGQNIGADLLKRVGDTFKWAAIMGSIPMAVLTLLCQWRPEMLLRGFTQEVAVLAVATQFLKTISWNFVASGLIFTCGGMFQALGNTVPSLIASGTRLLTFAVPVYWLSHRPSFEIKQVWYLSVITMLLQSLFTLWLLRGELQRKALKMASARLAV